MNLKRQSQSERTKSLYSYDPSKPVSFESEENKPIQNNYLQMLEREIWRLNGERDATCYILHEDVIQLLVAAKNYLHVLRRNENDSLIEVVEKVNTLLANAFYKLKEIHQQIASPPLGLLGLEGAIEELVLDTKRKSSTEIEVTKIDSQVNIIEDYQQLAIYKILKQLLDNSLQYSRAKKISIKLHLTNNKIMLEYQDNGVGFYNSKRFWRNGLLQIETLITAFNGKMIIKTSPGSGFSYVAHMQAVLPTQIEI
jgi:signal transduction histidine kinase